jgi:hypothetical protein
LTTNVALDDSPTVSYDRLDWHVDAALAAGQPPEHAFTHIGLYLAWLIRHDMVDPTFFPESHIAAIKGGEMTGSDLADDVDTKLVGPYMSAEGRAFSDARYSLYLDEYATVFADETDYGVADDSVSYARIAPTIDRLYAAWLADGRPTPPAAAFPDLPSLDLPMPQDLVAMSQEQIQHVMEEMAAQLGGVVSAPGWSDMPHASSRLEALLPRDITTPPLNVTSTTADLHGSSLLNRALKRLGVVPTAAIVAIGMGGNASDAFAITLFEIPGIASERLEDEFRTVIFLPPDAHWAPRVLAGRTINWASSPEFTVAFWANDGLVVQVAGPAPSVERAVPLLL